MEGQTDGQMDGIKISKTALALLHCMVKCSENFITKKIKMEKRENGDHMLTLINISDIRKCYVVNSYHSVSVGWTLK